MADLLLGIKLFFNIFIRGFCVIALKGNEDFIVSRDLDINMFLVFFVLSYGINTIISVIIKMLEELEKVDEGLKKWATQIKRG